ncbi:MAG: molybdopterin-dependent oxidoreductase [Gemmataceae bacterium]|nr:molybdopterin-dependent oxidoreductase [Gemmataceae bacterium]MCI0740373.1 molybdopterin-dependent oxidoreductase [Gemmataceae bacterium]
MAILYVNDKPVDIGSERLNVIQAAGRAGVFIPHYCWHPALSVVASCRMCLVEVGEKKPDGTVAMQPRVVPGCQTPAKDGTVIVTTSARAQGAQQQTLESLLLNHPLDCPVCDKAGECLLQDFSYRYGKSTSRMIDEKNQPPNKDYIGEHIALFADRCIMCSRCVRFTREVSGKAELQVISRGHHSEIDIFPGEPLNNKLAGNVVDLCPVGALCSKDFLYKQRVWFLKSKNSVCPECSTGCSIHVDANKDIVYRLRPRENPRAQGHFMCDEGRFDIGYINARARLKEPLSRQKDKQVAASWESVISRLRIDLLDAARREGKGVAAVLSPYLTCEEAYLLAKFMKGLSPEARLYLGWVPVEGEDDTYPKDRKGRPLQPVKFTIRAEKCPNRRGVEEILKHFHGEVLYFDRALEAAGAGEMQALYLTGGYPPRLGEWLPAPVVEKLTKVPLLVVQDMFTSAAQSSAKYVLPASSFAEKDGCFVNHAGLAQAIHWAVRPGVLARTDGQILLDLMERRELMHAETLRKDLGAEVPFFAPLKDGVLGDLGIRLAV